MKNYQPHQIKNVVLSGSSRAGKTTLSECMMFEGGVLERMGSVEVGNTVSDYHEIEQARGHSVFASILHTEWRGTKINLIDSPGQDDFSGELISALRVCDTALVTINAQYGVEVGTELTWRYLKEYHKPSIFVVNQVDHAKADFQHTVDTLHSQFGQGVTLVQYPYNPGEGFDCIIDLLKMVMYKFPEGGGKPEKLPIPDEERAKADELHNKLVEAAAEHDDTLMELYFEKGELDEDEMRKGIRIGMLRRDMFPVFCLSAKKNMGSGRLMGFIGNVAPSAGDMNPEISVTEQEIHVNDADTTLFIFKASNEKHTGSMSFFKVCSGKVKAGDELYNLNNSSKTKINQLYMIDGNQRHSVSELCAGDIGATVKLKDAHTNHTLRTKNDDMQIVPITFPEPKIRTAIEALNKGDEEKMAAALTKLHAGDPTLIPEYPRELKQTILHGQGELHLQTNKWMLEHVYGVKVQFIEPRISYRETIQKTSDGYYKHKKQSGGSGQYAEVYLRIAPYSEHMQHPTDIKVRGTEAIELPWGGTLLFCNCIVGGVIDTRFMPAILKGIREVCENAPLTGSYARDIAVYVYDGKMHAVDSNEISFKIAGQQSFKQAFLDSSPKLLEPIYEVNVMVPEEYMGDVMTDLQSRRAIVEGFNSEGVYQHITAKVPLAELYKYATSLSSVTQGRASHTRTFSGYSQVPGDVQAKLVNEKVSEVVS
ncbi:MAG: elongation factor G [Bacteroidota bacterium]